MLGHISDLARSGASQRAIAEDLGVSESTLSTRKRLSPELWAAIHPDRPFPGTSSEPEDSEPGSSAAYDPSLLEPDAALARLEDGACLRKLEEWAKIGLGPDCVARLLGVPLDALIERVAESPRAQRAIARGEARGEEEAAMAVWKLVNDPKHNGHTSALRFFLQTRAAWSARKPTDTPPVADSGPVMDENRRRELLRSAMQAPSGSEDD